MSLEQRIEALEEKVNRLLLKLDEDEIKRRSDMYLLSRLGAENLRDGAITAEKIATGAIIIGPGTVFEEGYNPIEKATSEDLQTAIGNLGDLAFADMVEDAMLGETIIVGGYIRTELLTADNIVTGTLSAARIQLGPETQFVEGYNPMEKATPDDIDAAVADKVTQTQLSQAISNLNDSLGDLAYENMVQDAMLGTTIIQGGYIRSELLTADNIVTGTMSANRIYGGTISGVTIDVTTDASIGRKLYLSSSSLLDGIFFGSYAEIYIDPPARSLILQASGGVWANNQRIDQGIVAVFG